MYLIKVGSYELTVVYLSVLLSICQMGVFFGNYSLVFFLIFCMMVDESPIFRENSPNIKVFKVFTKVLSLHFSGFGGK